MVFSSDFDVLDKFNCIVNSFITINIISKQLNTHLHHGNVDHNGDTSRFSFPSQKHYKHLEIKEINTGKEKIKTGKATVFCLTIPRGWDGL